MQNKSVIFDEEKLQEYAKQTKLQPFKVKQIFFEIFKNQNINFDEMTTLAKDLKSDLSNNFNILSLQQDSILEDKQTTKIWFKTFDNHIIESVIIYHRQDKKYRINNVPKLNRITLCISSQVWCPLNCHFCVTWKLWLKRNLSRQEIISQILFANNYIKNKLWKKDDWTLRGVRNVVFMWMGEPLLNYENLKQAITIMLAQDRLSLGKRHITISTAWIIDGIKKLIADKIDVKLAISLHSADQTVREKLMPIAKLNNLIDLMKILDEYVLATNNRIFYEYIMIKDFTDTAKLANQLSILLKWKLAHVNLIPFNANPVISLQESDKKTIYKFKEILEQNWLTVTIRDSMWRKVNSACGQLGYEKINWLKD